MASLFTDEVPTVSTGTLPWELGITIAFSAPGSITALRFWKLPQDIGQHVGRLWMPDGTHLTIPFFNETDEGWQVQAFLPTIAVTAGMTVTISVASLGHYPVDVNGVLAPITTGDLSCRALGAVYGSGAGKRPVLPSPHNYFRDVVFSPTLSTQFCALIVGE